MPLKRLPRFAAAGQAVRPLERRMEAGITLPHTGRLEMQTPRGIFRVGRRGVTRLRHGAARKQAGGEDSKHRPPSLTCDVPLLLCHARTRRLFGFIAWLSTQATSGDGGQRQFARSSPLLISATPPRFHQPPPSAWNSAAVSAKPVGLRLHEIDPRLLIGLLRVEQRRDSLLAPSSTLAPRDVEALGGGALGARPPPGARPRRS